jgi:hypothetical protein
MKNNVSLIIFTSVHIWEYSKYAGYEDALVALNKNEEFKRLMAKIKPMLRSRESQIVLEFAFWNATIPYDENSIYELRSYLLKPGRLLEWEQGWYKQYTYSQYIGKKD